MSRKPAKPASVVVPNNGDIGKADDSGNESVSAGGGDTGTGINPASVAGNDYDGNNGSEPGKRKRGRPAGSTNAKAKSVPANVSGIEKLLLGIHFSLSMVASEWAMDQDEASGIAQASADVLRHYKPDFIDQKTVDWINLIQIVGMAYGGRLLAIRERRKETRNKPVQLRPVKTEPFAPQEAPDARTMRVGEVPGLGAVVFPADHPLAPSRSN